MKKGLVINEDVWPLIDDLEPEEKAELFDILSAFYQGEEIPDVSRIVKMVFKRIALDNERFDPENRQKLSELRAEAGRKGGSKPKQKKQTEANESKNNKIAQEKRREEKNREDIEESREEESRDARSSRFVPPTVDDVKDYAWENGYEIDAQRFVDFYASKGWMVGRSKMKDWKAAVRNWAARDKKEALPFEDLDAGGFKVWEAI